MPPQTQTQDEVQGETPQGATPRMSKNLILVVLGIVVVILAILVLGGKSRTATDTTGQPLQGATVFTSEKGSVTVGTKPE